LSTKSEHIDFLRYLRTCLKNFCVTKKSSIIKRAQHEYSLTRERNEGGELIELDLDDSSLNPEAVNESREIHQIILNCTNNLPQKHQEIFLKSAIEGKSGPKIAEELGITQGNVRIMLLRAKQMVRECLKRKEIER
jgi:RNA polymerase sigma factor (sigma-70 family)